jgi:hypothetical protein
LASANPLSSNVEDIVDNLVEGPANTAEHRAELLQAYKKLEAERDGLEEQLFDLTAYKNDPELMPELHWWFASAEQRAQVKGDLEAWLLAAPGSDERNNAAKKLMSRLPAPSPELVAQTIADMKERLEKLGKAVAPLRAELRGDTLSGFTEWYRLQMSYKISCGYFQMCF